MLDLAQPLMLLLQAVFGALGTYLFQYLKIKMGLKNTPALLLVLLSSLALSSLVTFVSGGFTGIATAPPEDLVGLYTTFLSVNYLFFKFFMGSKNEE